MDITQLSDEELLNLKSQYQDGFITPVPGKITSTFQDSRNGGLRAHGSGDIAAEQGTPVVAPGNMKVLGYQQGGTNLRDNDWWLHGEDVDTGIKYKFAHIGDVSHLKEGQVISKGEQFTQIGNAIDRPHLHLKVESPQGEAIDWVKKSGLGKGKNVTPGVLAKISDWLGPVSAEAAEGIDLSKISTEELLKMQEQKAESQTDLSKIPTEELIKMRDQGQQPLELDQQDYKKKIGGFTDTPLDKVMQFPEQLRNDIASIIDWPHQNISTPIGEKLASYIPEGSIKVAPFAESGELPQETPIDFSPKEFAKTVLPMALDIPVYGATIKAVGSAGAFLGNLLPKSKGLFTPVETVTPTIKGSSLENQLKEEVIKIYEAKSYPSATIPGVETIGKGKKARDVLAPAIEQFPIGEKLTPLATEKYVKAATRENQAIIDAAPTQWSREKMKFLHSGGPSSEELQSFLGDHLAKGGTLGSAIQAIANKFKVSPETVMGTIRNMSQTSAGTVGTGVNSTIQELSAAIDTTNASLAQAISGPNFKANLPSLREVGVEVPKIPEMPYKIDPAGNTTPKGNLNQAKAEFLSPSITSRNLFSGDGPIFDWFKAWHQTLFEQPYHRRFLNNIYKESGLLDGIKSARMAMEEKIGPLSKRLESVLQDYNVVQADLASARALLPKQARGSAAAQETEAKIAQLSQIGYPKEASTLEKEVELIFQELERVHPDIRIQRAIDGNKTSLSLLSPEEKMVADKLAESYKQFGGRFQQQGVPTIAGNYSHHIYHWGGYDTDTGLRAFANKLWWQPETTPQLLTFLSREGATNWFPSAYHSYDAYIGAAARKLAFNPWYAKWTPAMDRWDATGMGNTSKWLRDFLGRNMTSAEAGIIDRSVNSLVNFEYGHYLMGNFSPAILHAFKVLQTPAYWGFGASGKGVGQYAEGMVSKVGKGKSANLRATEFYNLTPQLIQELEQAPAWAGTFQPSFWQKLRGNPILNPTRLTEHFDRGVQTLSAINAGEKVGATANMMNDAIMDSLLRMNFYGWDSPAFMQRHRALTMFQQQPWKLTEMKGQLLRDAIVGETDPYGKSHWPKLVRLAVILGGVYEAGDLAGVDLGKHTWKHLPFMADTMSGEHGIAVSPAVGDVMQLKQTFDEGWRKGLKNYLSYGGAIQKLMQERIPERYGDSRAQWLMGVPTADWREKAHEKSESIENRLRRRTLRGAAMRSGDVSPYNLLLQMLEE